MECNNPEKKVTSPSAAACLDNADVENAADSTEIHVGSFELPRKTFSLLSLAGIGLVTGNTWPALSGSLAGSISNGGSPGVIFGFLAASLCCFCVAAVVCELASAMPSSSGVLLWSTVLAGDRYGRMVGYFAGWWNSLTWIFAQASMSNIAASICIEIYASTNPAYVPRAWHNLLCYLLITWTSCMVVCLAQNAVPKINIAGLIIILTGAIVTVVVCLTMTAMRDDLTPSSNVWTGWKADIGYPTVFVFLSGMLNGAFAMGAADAATRLAEEIRHPETNVPKAIICQYALGFATGFAYLLAILYSIGDYSALDGVALPVAAVYRQATGSAAGTVSLLVMILLPVLACTIGLYVTCGRALWTLARIGATPFAEKAGRLSKTRHVPVNATLQSACVITVLGCIELGSSAAFNAFVNSFILHSTASYLAAAIPYLLRRRYPGTRPGPFYMREPFGWIVHVWACSYMLIWFVIYSFPPSLPTSAATMNYSSLIWGGLTLFEVLWWLVSARHKCIRTEIESSY